nr:YdeI/OmpD-associated family protein [Vagococcus proximus]
MVSLDDTFTIVGLKYSTKQQLKLPTKSQIASDYDHLVPDVINLLNTHPDERLFFEALTPGYQRSWARFIFSAKQQVTQTKRTDTMITCLKAGFKSHDLYRQSLK